MGRRGLGAAVRIGRAGPGPEAGAGLTRGGFAAGTTDLEPGVAPEGALRLSLFGAGVGEAGRRGGSVSPGAEERTLVEASLV